MPGRNSSTDIGTRLGRKIARLRAERNWSQSEFARRAGLSASYVRLLEYGYNVPTLIVLIHLAPMFGQQPWELVRELTEPAQSVQ